MSELIYPIARSDKKGFANCVADHTGRIHTSTHLLYDISKGVSELPQTIAYVSYVDYPEVHEFKPEADIDYAISVFPYRTKGYQIGNTIPSEGVFPISIQTKFPIIQEIRGYAETKMLQHPYFGWALRMGFINLDVPIVHGNSGSPVFINYPGVYGTIFRRMSGERLVGLVASKTFGEITPGVVVE